MAMIVHKVALQIQRHLWIDSYRIIRLLLVVLIFFASALIVPQAMTGSRNILLLLALIPAAIGGLVLLRWPDIGLVLIIVAGLVVPFGVGTGTQTSLNGSLLLTALLISLWIFKMIASRETGIERVTRPFWPAVGLIMSALVSFCFGQFRWYIIPGASITAQIGGVAIFALSAGAFLLVAYHLQSLTTLRWMVGVFLAIAGLYMIARAIPPLGSLVIRFYQRPIEDSPFWLWFAVLGFGQAVFNKNLSIQWRAVIGIAVLFSLYNAYFAMRGWTSGWLPMVLAIGVCVFVARPLYAIPGLIVVVMLLFINAQQAQSTLMVGDNSYSLMTRLEAWRVLGQIMIANPVFGLGPSNYYWYTLLFPILGYNVTFNSHNNYVDILLQTGIVGLVVFLWFAYEIGVALWNACQRAPEGFERAFLYSCFGGLVATVISGMLGDWFLPFVYNIGLEGFRASVLIWLFLGGAIALERRLPVEGVLHGEK